MGTGENTNTSITKMQFIIIIIIIFFLEMFSMDVGQQHFLDIVPVNIFHSRFTGQFDSVVDDSLLF
jgi:hypothetical protein